MKTLKIKNLDSLYSYLKEKTSTLGVDGYDVEFTGINYAGESTLMDWFFKNLKSIKEGCSKLLVAEAEGIGNYAHDGDSVWLWSIPSTDMNFITIVVETSRYYYNQNSFDERTKERDGFILELNIEG